MRVVLNGRLGGVFRSVQTQWYFSRGSPRQETQSFQYLEPMRVWMTTATADMAPLKIATKLVCRVLSRALYMLPWAFVAYLLRFLFLSSAPGARGGRDVADTVGGMAAVVAAPAVVAVAAMGAAGKREPGAEMSLILMGTPI